MQNLKFNPACPDSLSGFPLVFLFLIIIILLIPGISWAAFSLNISAADLAFGQAGDSGWSGGWKEIPETGDYFNQVTCTSDQGNQWRLQIKASGPLRHESLAGVNINISALKWMSTWSNGSGTLLHPPAQGYVAFTETYNTIYTSTAAGGEIAGTPVNVQFKYAILISDYANQTAGNYTTTLEYIMTE